MKPPNDPPRLLDGTTTTGAVGSGEHDRAVRPSALFLAGLGAARDDLPNADALARMGKRLPPSSGPAPGGSPPGGSPPRGGPVNGAGSRALASSRAVPFGAAGVVAGAALLAVLLLRRGPLTATPLAPAATAEATATAAAAAGAAPTATAEAPAASAAASPTPPASAAVEAPRAPPTAAAPASSASAAPDGESEIALLQRAQEALGSSPARALAITGEHVTRFPRGALSQEREVLAVTALARLGRATEARARAAQFAARYPSSVHRRRLEAIVTPESARDGGAEAPGSP